MTTSCTFRDHRYYEISSKMSIKDMDLWLRQDGKMKGESLGECLDFISGGAVNYVVLADSVHGLVGFIEEWMKQNSDRLIWNREDLVPLERKIELPHIDYKVCPSDDHHKQKIEDGLGLIRCAHKKHITLKDGWFDEDLYQDPYAATSKINFIDLKPFDSTPAEWTSDDGESLDYSEKYIEYRLNLKMYEEAQDISIIDVCWAIVSDKKSCLPLETVMRRLSVMNDDNYCCFPFSGFTLADYAQAWYEQDEKALYEDMEKRDNYKVFTDFLPIGVDY